MKKVVNELKYFKDSKIRKFRKNKFFGDTNFFALKIQILYSKNDNKYFNFQFYENLGSHNIFKFVGKMQHFSKKNYFLVI